MQRIVNALSPRARRSRRSNSPQEGDHVDTPDCSCRLCLIDQLTIMEQDMADLHQELADLKESLPSSAPSAKTKQHQDDDKLSMEDGSTRGPKAKAKSRGEDDGGSSRSSSSSSASTNSGNSSRTHISDESLPTKPGCDCCQNLKDELAVQSARCLDLKRENYRLRYPMSYLDDPSIPLDFLVDGRLHGEDAVGWSGPMEQTVDLAVFDNAFDPRPSRHAPQEVLPQLHMGVKGIASMSLDERMDIYKLCLKRGSVRDQDFIRQLQRSIYMDIRGVKFALKLAPKVSRSLFLLRYFAWRNHPSQEYLQLGPDDDRAFMSRFLHEQFYELKNIPLHAHQELVEFFHDRQYCKPCTEHAPTWMSTCNSCRGKRSQRPREDLSKLQRELDDTAQELGLDSVTEKPAVSLCLMSAMFSQKRLVKLANEHNNKGPKTDYLFNLLDKSDLLESDGLVENLDLNALVAEFMDEVQCQAEQPNESRNLIQSRNDKTLYFDYTAQQVMVLCTYSQAAKSEQDLAVWASRCVGNGTSDYRLSPFAATIFHAGQCEIDGRPFLFWIMEMGKPVDIWLQELWGMESFEAVALVRTFILVLCTALVTMSTIAGITHKDVKGGNLIAVPSIPGNQFLLTTSGAFEMQPAPSFQLRFIDFGQSMYNIPSPFFSAATPEYGSPLQLLGIEETENHRDDMYGAAMLIIMALNMGRNFWKSKKGFFIIFCPEWLRAAIHPAINFERMGIAVDASLLRNRFSDAFYRYVVFSYTLDRKVLKALIDVCPKLQGLDAMLVQSTQFKYDVTRFSLADGVLTSRIRTCTIFKNVDHAVTLLHSLIDPLADTRLLPEELVTFIK